MVLESTMVCVDNSEYMRNGDFIPTRLQAQQDAINLICQSKTRSNPENNVGLVTLTKGEVLVTLTSDAGNVMAKLHQVQPSGYVNFTTGIRVAHLALKHRLGKNHKMRIIAFVGSPIESDDKELQKLAKRLKKEKVNVDIVNFGEDAANTDVLTNFINCLNGKDGTSSHIVTVACGSSSSAGSIQSNLADALISSPVVQGEDGSGAVPFAGMDEFGIDPNADPELALALRVSMEEQRARQEAESRRQQQGEGAVAAGGLQPVAEGEAVAGSAGGAGSKSEEEQLLERALAMSMEQPVVSDMETGGSGAGQAADADPDRGGGMSVMELAGMSEEEQIAFAMQMSLQQQTSQDDKSEEAMEVDATGTDKGADDKKKQDAGGDEEEEDEDDDDIIADREFLQEVLGGLPGVDTKSDTVQQAISNISKQQPGGKSDDDDKPTTDTDKNDKKTDDKGGDEPSKKK